MSEIKFWLDQTAFRNEVLKSDWMMNAIQSEAVKQAGSDTHIKSFKGTERATAIIYPNTKRNPG